MGEFLRTFRVAAGVEAEMVMMMIAIRITGEKSENQRHSVRCNMIHGHEDKGVCRPPAESICPVVDEVIHLYLRGSDSISLHLSAAQSPASR